MMDYDKTERAEGRYMTMPLCERSTVNEVSGEFVLPDYQAEIRRLLFVGTTVLPPAKYVGGARVELDGTVDYQILYVGADGELYSAPLSSEYSVAIPLENASDFDLNEGVCVMARAEAEGVTARVSAPRKLTLRTRLRTSVQAFGKQPIGARLYGECDEQALCVRHESAPMARLWSVATDPIELSDEITDVAPDIRVVTADAAVAVSEASPADGGMRTQGEVILRLLCANPDGATNTLIRKLPFDGVLTSEEEIPAGSRCRVSGCVSDLSVQVEEGKILCDAHLSLDARIYGNEELVYRADLYSTSCPTDCSYEEHALPVVLSSVQGNLSQSERLAAADYGIAEGAQIVQAFGTATWERCDAADGKYVLSGQSRYVLVCEKDHEYSAVEVLLPLRYECEGTPEAPSGFDASASVIACRAKVNGEVLELDAELSVCATVMGKATVCCVSEVRFGEPVTCRDNDLILCFPSPEDTLWSVAKRYMVAPDAVHGDPETGRYLVIGA